MQSSSSSSDHPVDLEENDVTEHQQEEPDFFSFFYPPAYEDSVNFGSSITSSVSAMMGGIFAVVVDTALAVLNEEFDDDTPEDSLMPSFSNDSNTREEYTTNYRSEDKDALNDSEVKCRRRNRRSKMSKMGTNGSATSSVAFCDDKKNILGSVSLSDSEDAMLQSSIIGSISKLELHEDDCDGKERKIEGDYGRIADSLQDNTICVPGKKVDSSDYCIVEKERETKDGWLVVIDQ